MQIVETIKPLNHQTSEGLKTFSSADEIPQPFELIEPFELQKLLKPQKPLKPHQPLPTHYSPASSSGRTTHLECYADWLITYKFYRCQNQYHLLVACHILKPLKNRGR